MGTFEQYCITNVKLTNSLEAINLSKASFIVLYVFVMRCIAYPFNAKQPTDMARRQQKPEALPPWLQPPAACLLLARGTCCHVLPLPLCPCCSLNHECSSSRVLASLPSLLLDHQLSKASPDFPVSYSHISTFPALFLLLPVALTPPGTLCSMVVILHISLCLSRELGEDRTALGSIIQRTSGTRDGGESS
ncbi:hypothetical protein CB1_000705006 [Camelus ferus]|nr:hypothetical protein CB1_000705006 [Camelus ferus]